MSVEPPESLSIFCRVPEFGRVPQILAVRGFSLSASSDPSERVVVSCGIHTLNFAAMHWAGPGEALATTIRGALAYVRRITDPNTETARQILTSLTASRLLIGVTGGPRFLSHDPCIESIHAVAAKFDGLLFDGTNIYSPRGALLVSP